MKFPKGLRLRLEFTALWTAIVLARAMPVQTASWLSGNIWRLIAPRLGRQKRALANLEFAYPEKSPGERKAIAAAMWENLGRTFAESLHIKALTKSDRIVFEPAEGFDEAARGAKPFIVCGLHLGNWEILAHGGQRLGVSLIGVYHRMSNPHVEALMHSVRKAPDRRCDSVLARPCFNLRVGCGLSARRAGWSDPRAARAPRRLSLGRASSRSSGR
jgi:Kdo2-lipid IVA lauroyltransferase/acyltransferase